MIKTYTLLLFVLSTFLLDAQSLDITNQYVFGSSSSDGLAVYPSPNGDGYYLIGASDGNTSFDKSEDSRGGYDVWIVKTDNNFIKEWDRTYGGDQDDYYMNAIVLDDKIIISATSSSNTSGDKTMDLWGWRNIWNICIDLNGDLLWQFQYGGDGGEDDCDIISFSDTSVLMAIQTFSDISGNKTQNRYGARDVWLVEAAISDGHIIQQRNVGSSGADVFPKIVKSSVTNRTFMACISGSGVADFDKTDPGFLNNDIWLTEIDNSLNVVQDKCFGGDNFEEFPRIAIDENNDIIIGSKTRSGISGNKTTERIATYSLGYDCWFVKVNQNFDILWDKSYGGTQNQGVTSIIALSTGQLVVNCTSSSNQDTGNKTSENFGGLDGWLLFLDDNGDDILQASLGGSGTDGVLTIQHPTDPTKLIFSSSSDSPISGNKTVAPKGVTDAWIGVLDYDATAGTLELVESAGISAFPNPSNGEVSIQFKALKEKSTISFVTVDGKVLETVEITEGTSSFTWQTAHKGMVFYTVSGESTQLQGKLVFE